MFSRLRLRKVWADLWVNELRSFMAVLAIAIGLFGVGSILSAYAILNREIDANFMQTTPASIRLYIDNADSRLADTLVALPEIAAVELRRKLQPRMQLDDENWLPMVLFVVDDFEAMQLATFTSEVGNWPPAAGEMLLERSSVNIQNVALGDTVTVQLPDGVQTALTFSGIVHDPAQSPGWQESREYGYITGETLALLGEGMRFNEVHLLVTGDVLNEDRNREIAQQVRAVVEDSGYTVSALVVPTPGRHPHTDQMDSLLFLIQAFGWLALLLSGVLVATIVSALIKQQTRQIGAMKAIGGRGSQVAAGYLAMVLLLGVVALLLSVPLSVSAGNGIANFTATLLNFDITDNSIPSWVFAVQIIVGLTVPLLAAIIPIYVGTKVSVRAALGDFNVGRGQFGTSAIDRLIMRTKGVQRPILLAIRNTFRRRLRLSLIVLILAIGGATFVSAINVNQSWRNTIAKAFESRDFDFDLDLSAPYPTAQVEAALANIPEITEIETWNSAIVAEALADGTDGMRFNLSAVPPETDLINYPLIAGRWLEPDDTNALVINHNMYYDDHSDIAVGDTVELRFNGVPVTWEVVGVILEVGTPRRGLGNPASAYVSLPAFNDLTGQAETTTTVRIKTKQRDAAYLAALQPVIDDALVAAEINVKALEAGATRRVILENHLVVIVAFLMLMAVLIAAVGALALAAMVSINVMERAREIGMMRSVGASTAVIYQVVMVEALVIGLLSWLVSGVLARPLSVLLGNVAGQIFIRADLNHVFSKPTLLVWLLIIVLVSLAASIFPARSAAQLSVREVLAYE